MEDILRPIYQERASQTNTQGILVIEKKQKEVSSTDTFDSILLIVVKEAEQPLFIKHYSYGQNKAALHIVTEEQIKEWILLGTNRRIFDWLYSGQIVFDRNEYFHNLKKELQEFPFHGRKLKMGLEFAKLIKRYMDGKVFFENNNFLDAYNYVVHSLHHLARLSIVENGFHPEVTVWNQVKQIEPAIYKLYDELVNSRETLGKRLELLFLASEFLIHSKTSQGATHILEVLTEKDHWSINEILHHPELKEYSIDLGMLIEYLIDRGHIDVINVETKGLDIYHRYYRVAKKYF